MEDIHKNTSEKQEAGKPKTEHLVVGQRFQFERCKTEYVIGAHGEAKRVAGKLISKKLRNKLKKQARKEGIKWEDHPAASDIDRNLYENKQQQGRLV